MWADRKDMAQRFGLVRAQYDGAVARLNHADFLRAKSHRELVRKQKAPVIDFAEHCHTLLGLSVGGAQTRTGPSTPQIRSQRLCS